MGYSSNINRQPTNYLFIDGGYFRKYLEFLSRKYFDSEAIPIDYDKLKMSYKKVFYYDCLPAKKACESREEFEQRLNDQRRFFDLLKMINGFHVYEGSMSGVDGKARQKQVDIMIAVHMLSHTIRGNMDGVTLLAGDLDFKPLIDALVQEGMYVTLWYDHKATSKELIYSSDERHLLNPLFIWNCIEPEFRNIRSFPNVFRVNFRSSKFNKLIKDGVTSDGTSIQLHHNSEENLHIIAYKVKRSDGEVVVAYPDVNLLIEFVKDCGIYFEWIDQVL